MPSLITLRTVFLTDLLSLPPPYLFFTYNPLPHKFLSPKFHSSLTILSPTKKYYYTHRCQHTNKSTHLNCKYPFHITALSSCAPSFKNIHHYSTTFINHKLSALIHHLLSFSFFFNLKVLSNSFQSSLRYPFIHHQTQSP